MWFKKSLAALCLAACTLRGAAAEEDKSNVKSIPVSASQLELSKLPLHDC